MKHLYIVALAAALCVPGASAASRFKAKAAKRPSHAAVLKAPAAGTWRPASVTEYMYGLVEENEWAELGTTDFTYDARGNVATEKVTYAEEEDAYTITEYTYNENNRILKSETSDFFEGELMPTSRMEYTWDAIVKDFYTSRMGYDFTGEDWAENYKCETREVSRDAAGNVTGVLTSLPLAGEMKPAYKSVWTYGEDGKANAYEYYGNYSYTGETEWTLVEGTSYRNITWDATDGQLVEGLEAYREGNNRIASAEIYYMDELDGYLFLEYKADKPGDYVLRETYMDPTVAGRVITKEMTDANGSYTITTAEYFDAEGNFTEEPTYVEVNTVVFDETGTLLENRMDISSSVEGYTALYIEQSEAVYDENGNLHELTTYLGEGEGEYGEEVAVELIPSYRMVYGEYTDITTGIGNVQAGAGYPATVYNAQGMAVKTIADESELQTLPAGFYIVNGRKFIRR